MSAFDLRHLAVATLALGLLLSARPASAEQEPKPGTEATTEADSEAEAVAAGEAAEDPDVQSEAEAAPEAGTEAETKPDAESGAEKAPAGDAEPGPKAAVEVSSAIRVAVLQLKAGEEIPAETVNALGDLVANSIDGLGNFQIIGTSDVEALIGFEATKQLVGCDDASCLAEMSGALGVRYLVSGSVARIGTAWLINLRLIDLDQAEVSSRASGKSSGGDETVIDAIPPLVAELFAPLTGEVPPPSAEPGDAWRRPKSQLRLLAAAEVTLAHGKREFLDIVDVGNTRNRNEVGVREGFQYGGGVKLALVLWGPFSTELVFGVRAGGAQSMVYIEPMFFELDIAPIPGTNIGFLVGFGWHLAWEQFNDNWHQGDGFGLSPNRVSVGLDWEPTSWLRLAFEGGVVYYSNDATKLVSHGTEGLLVPHLTVSAALIPLRYD